ncbi:hypothetical protein B0T19DRAFT_105289 [Cercophora scortea]|uniref:Uncharacterized protein n=1 Tax=Cercophora scortea TaxID=314031 RepID=A0AAE0IWD5_9PEZI|nr:hypothetical protein B0T19DRAFT_105289 [Cercophora scortea]
MEALSSDDPSHHSGLEQQLTHNNNNNNHGDTSFPPPNSYYHHGDDEPYHHHQLQLQLQLQLQQSERKINPKTNWAGTSSRQQLHRHPRGQQQRNEDSAGGGREWTDFEMQVILALLCKGVHRKPGNPLTFATALNEALNGGGGGEQRLRLDVDLEDVKELLAWVCRDKKGCLAFIERQTPQRITRRITHVFARHLDFDGSLKEWTVDGRRDVEAMKRPETMQKLAERMQREEDKRLARLESRQLMTDRDRTPSRQLDDARFENMYEDGLGAERSAAAASPTTTRSPLLPPRETVAQHLQHEETSAGPSSSTGFIGGFTGFNPVDSASLYDARLHPDDLRQGVVARSTALPPPPIPGSNTRDLAARQQDTPADGSLPTTSIVSHQQSSSVQHKTHRLGSGGNQPRYIPWNVIDDFGNSYEGAVTGGGKANQPQVPQFRTQAEEGHAQAQQIEIDRRPISVSDTTIGSPNHYPGSATTGLLHAAVPAAAETWTSGGTALLSHGASTTADPRHLSTHRTDGAAAAARSGAETPLAVRASMHPDRRGVLNEYLNRLG